MLGLLPNHMVAASKTLVTPVIGAFRRDILEMHSIKPNPHEFDKIFYLSLESLNNPNNKDVHFTYPRFLHHDYSHHIWGFTGFILDYFLRTIRDIK